MISKLEIVGIVFSLWGMCVTGYHFPIGVVDNDATRNPVLALALMDANNLLAPSGDSLSFRRFDAFDFTTNLFSALDLLDFRNDTQGSVWGVVGITASNMVVPVSRVLAPYNVPIISHNAASAELSDKAQYPFFSRVVPQDSRQASALAALVATQGWKRVGILATSDVLGAKMTQSFSSACSERGVSVVQATSFQAGNVDAMKAALALMRQSDVRIIAVFASNGDVQPLIAQIVLAGMEQPPYLYLGITSNIAYAPFPIGALGVDVFANLSTPAAQGLQARLPTGVTLTVMQARIYDAVMLMTQSLVVLSQIRRACEGGTTLPAGYTTVNCTNIIQPAQARLVLNSAIRKQTMTGVAGPIALDANGDNIVSSYTVLNQISQPSNFRTVYANPKSAGFDYFAVAQSPQYLRSVAFINAAAQVTMTGAIHWPDGTALIPTDRRGVRLGDAVEMETAASTGVLAFAAAVVGSWVSLILAEQAIASRVRKTTRTTIVWLLLVAVVLSVGFWSSMAINAAASHFPSLPDNSVRTFDGIRSFLPLLWLIPIIFCGLLLTVRGVHSKRGAKVDEGDQSVTYTADGQVAQTYMASNSSNTSKSSGTSHGSAAAGHEEAAQEQHPCKHYFLNRLDRNLFFGAIVVMAGIVSSGVVQAKAVLIPCSQTPQSGFLALGILLGFLFVYLGLYFFFHFRITQWRFVGAFVMAISVTVFETAFLQGQDRYYTGINPAEKLTGTTVTLVAAILIALISFLFMGLNVTRLKLSRDLLDNYLLQTQKKVKTLEKGMAGQADTISDLRTVIHLIHLLAPATRKDHFALQNLVSNAQARMALYGPISSPKSAHGPHASRGSFKSLPSAQSGASEERGTPTHQKQLAMWGTSSTVASGSADRKSSILAASNGGDLALLDVLNNPVTLEVFKHAVANNRNSENLSFWVDVQAYRRLPESSRLDAAREMCATFFAPSAPCSLNISGTLRQAVLSKVPSATDDAPSQQLFDAVETEVLRLLVINDWTRFKDADGYHVCRSILQAAQYIKALRSGAIPLERDASVAYENVYSSLDQPNDTHAVNEKNADDAEMGSSGLPAPALLRSGHRSAADSPGPRASPLSGSVLPAAVSPHLAVEITPVSSSPAHPHSRPDVEEPGVLFIDEQEPDPTNTQGVSAV